MIDSINRVVTGGVSVIMWIILCVLSGIGFVGLFLFNYDLAKRLVEDVYASPKEIYENMRGW